MSSKAETLEAVQQWIDLWDARDWSRMPSVLAPSYVRHGPEGTRLLNRDDHAKETAAQYGALTVELEHDVFVDDDTGFIILGGSDPTIGDFSGVEAHRVTDGLIAESWFSPPVMGVRWPLRSEHEGDAEAGRRLLHRWYDEMYADLRFAELAPQLCGPTFTRHEASGSFVATVEEHTERLIEVYGGRAASVSEYRVVASGEMVGVIGKLPLERRGFVQAWRVDGGKLVESWWPGFVDDVDW